MVKWRTRCTFRGWVSDRVPPQKGLGCLQLGRVACLPVRVHAGGRSLFSTGEYRLQVPSVHGATSGLGPSIAGLPPKPSFLHQKAQQHLVSFPVSAGTCPSPPVGEEQELTVFCSWSSRVGVPEVALGARTQNAALNQWGKTCSVTLEAAVKSNRRFCVFTTLI